MIRAQIAFGLALALTTTTTRDEGMDRSFGVRNGDQKFYKCCVQVACQQRRLSFLLVYIPGESYLFVLDFISMLCWFFFVVFMGEVYDV